MQVSEGVVFIDDTREPLSNFSEFKANDNEILLTEEENK